MGKNRISYHKKLFLWLLCYSTLLVGCFVIFQYIREKQFKYEELNLRLQDINGHILDNMDAGVPVKVTLSASDTAILQHLRISLIDTTGRVIYDNSLDSFPSNSHLNRKEIVSAMANGSGYDIRRHSESTGLYYFYSATLGNNGYIVRTAIPYSVSLHELLKADFGFIWITVLIAVAMCVLGYFATRRVGQHLWRLTRFAERAERGERIYDTKPFPDDEFGAISNHIVRLYAGLQQSNIERNREHEAAMREHREKERIKKQLTSNINHELNTPVAAIQMCLETLLAHENLSPDKKRDFLERSLVNVERLKSLIRDVSLIARMDENGDKVSKEALDLVRIINDVVADFEPLAEAKGIIIHVSVGTSIKIEGNKVLLMSIFQNLMNNVIAYSGASEINISLMSCDGRRIVIEFADNGCGIPEEHIPHIFERFYRVDKGRSRSLGGTGLGLSIVKNAVLLHGGEIFVRNSSEGGAVFRISLSVS